MFDRILVPVDGSKNARLAVDMAVQLARCHGSTVFLLHVIRDLSLPPELMEMISTGEVNESRVEILRNSAEIILDGALDKFVQAGVANVHGEYVIGDPAGRILEYAHEQGVDLIVIGYRGLGPHSGMLGGVARKIVNMTDISVLVAV